MSRASTETSPGDSDELVPFLSNSGMENNSEVKMMTFSFLSIVFVSSVEVLVMTDAISSTRSTVFGGDLLRMEGRLSYECFDFPFLDLVRILKDVF